MLLSFRVSIFFIFILNLKLLAQSDDNPGSIKGAIYDDNKVPVTDVVVILKRNNDSTVLRSVLSDNRGLFTFLNIGYGDYMLYFNKMGYKVVSGSVIHITPYNPFAYLGPLILVQTAKTLNEVVIKYQKPFVERKAEKTIINLENSIIGQGTSAFEILEKLPGVLISQSGQLSLGGKSEVSVFIDGKATLLSAADLEIFLKGMLSTDIEKVELITNPSAKFEAAGSGGVINIIKKKNRKEGLNGNFNLGYGRGKYDRYNGSFDISYKNKVYNLFLNNSYNTDKTFLNSNAVSDFFESNVHAGRFSSFNHHIKNNWTYNPTIGAEFFLSQTTVINISGTGQIQTFNTKSDSYTNTFDKNDTQLNNLGFRNNSRDPAQNYSTGLHLAHKIDTAGQEFSADLDYSNFNNSSEQNIFNTVNDPQLNFLNSSNSLLDQNSKLHIYSAKADYVHPLKDNAKLELGVKSSYVDTKNDSRFYDITDGQNNLNIGRSNQFNYTENINATYVNYNHNYQGFSYQIGLRTEQTVGKGDQLLTHQQFKRNYFQLFPSVFFEYKINDKSSLSISSGRKVDRPGYSSLNPLLRFVNATAYLQGDPGLQPQSSFTNELKFSHGNSFFISLGYSVFSNYITYWVFPESNIQNQSTEVIVSRPVNIDRATSYSADFLYSKKVVSWWSTNNSLTLYYNIYNGEINGYNLDNQGIPSFLLSTNNQVTLTKTIALEANFRYNYKSQSGTAVYKPNSNLSLGIRKLMFSDRAALSLNLNDVFRSQNFIWTSNSGNVVESRDVRGDSRAVKLNFAYRFGKGNPKRITVSKGSEEERGRARN